MKNLSHLLENNRSWANNITKHHPEFFPTLAKQQSPDYLWIGCSDSRVPANEIVGLLPGELFVHRNVANLVIKDDTNCLSVIQYAIDILKVKHIIVCGHYGCGGVKAAMEDRSHGFIDNWLRPVRNIFIGKHHELINITTEEERINKLCEFNVIEQVINAGNTKTVQNAWNNGQELIIHGWIYGISDGLIKDLGVCVSSSTELKSNLKKYK